MYEEPRIEKSERTRNTSRSNLPLIPESITDTPNDLGVASDRQTPPSTPRWVKVSLIIAIALVVLLVILQFTGGDHGPARHSSYGSEPPGNTIYASVIKGTLSGDQDGDYISPYRLSNGFVPSVVEIRGYTTFQEAEERVKPL